MIWVISLVVVALWLLMRRRLLAMLNRLPENRWLLDSWLLVPLVVAFTPDILLAAIVDVLKGGE
jgi:hypothetical protein